MNNHPNSVECCTIRFIILDQIAGIFIGKNGCKIQELRRLIKDARINISDGNSQERIVTLTHTHKLEIFEYLKLSLERISDAERSFYQISPDNKGGLMKAKFLVPPHWSSLSKITEIKNFQMNTNTLVEPSCVPMSLEVTLQITGELDNIIQCYRQISEKCGGDSAAEVETTTSSVNDVNCYKQEIIMSNSQIGSIIGRRGTVISSIRRRSQAEIHISENQGDSRKIVITGRIDRVLLAINLIQRIISNGASPSPVNYPVIPPRYFPY